MNKILRYSFVALLAMIGLNISAQEVCLRLHWQRDNWGFPTEQY